MRLDSIITDAGVISFSGDPALEIRAICSDSRKAVPGSLFIAVKGFAGDGHSYIAVHKSRKSCGALCFDRT